MIRAANQEFQPPIASQAVVDRADVRFHLARLRHGLPAVITKQKEERLSDAVGDSVAKWSAVDINARFAPPIVMAKLERRGPAQRVAENSNPLHIKPASKSV